VHNKIQTKFAFKANTDYSTDVQQDCSLTDHIIVIMNMLHHVSFIWCAGAIEE